MSTRQIIWVLHHLNGYWADENLLVLSSESIGYVEHVCFQKSIRVNYKYNQSTLNSLEINYNRNLVDIISLPQQSRFKYKNDQVQSYIIQEILMSQNPDYTEKSMKDNTELIQEEFREDQLKNTYSHNNAEKQNMKKTENVQTDMIAVEIEALVDENYKMVIAEAFRLKIENTCFPVMQDINPVARLNRAVEIFLLEVNKILDVHLFGVWLPSVISKPYDLLVYLYVRWYMTISCQSDIGQYSLLASTLMLIIYLILLVAPFISPVTFTLSAIFFIYFVIGIIVKNINHWRLGGHLYQQNMIHEEDAPAFYGYFNQFFQLKSEETKFFYRQNNKMELFEKLKRERKFQFMAYRDEFLTENYNYISSCKMVWIHLAFMTFAWIGLIVSVRAFPTIYSDPSTNVIEVY